MLSRVCLCFLLLCSAYLCSLSSQQCTLMLPAIVSVCLCSLSYINAFPCFLLLYHSILVLPAIVSIYVYALCHASAYNQAPCHCISEYLCSIHAIVHAYALLFIINVCAPCHCITVRLAPYHYISEYLCSSVHAYALLFIIKFLCYLSLHQCMVAPCHCISAYVCFLSCLRACLCPVMSPVYVYALFHGISVCLCSLSLHQCILLLPKIVIKVLYHQPYQAQRGILTRIHYEHGQMLVSWCVWFIMGLMYWWADLNDRKNGQRERENNMVRYKHTQLYNPQLIRHRSCRCGPTWLLKVQHLTHYSGVRSKQANTMSKGVARGHSFQFNQILEMYPVHFAQ